MVARSFLGFLLFAVCFFNLLNFIASKLPQGEVDALQQIITTLGSTYWKFDADTCAIQMVGLTQVPPRNSEHEIGCECRSENDSDCHVIRIKLKDHNLPGTLPPQMVKLPYLQEIDLAYNYLNGSIPREWASMKLNFISLLVNRLSGEIPGELGNITTLKYLNLEANHFTGTIPQELGNLLALQTLILSSNNFSGNLLNSLSRLRNLTDFRINDNQFNGSIPSLILNWKHLTRLELVGSGLRGPIPSAISELDSLNDLRIGDITGPDQPFPLLKNSTGLVRLVLKNCNLYGEIPGYLGTMQNMEMLDLSFNKLTGEIPSTAHAKRLRLLFLSGNMLSGDIPDSTLTPGTTVDLSYNNLTWQGPERHACQKNMNLNLNLFRSSSMRNSRGILPCMKDFKCPRYSNCLHVNCGGNDATVKENQRKVLYEGDGDVEGGAAKFYLNPDNYWGFSSTGDFMDDFDVQNTRYTVFLPSTNMSDLYATARISPTSLTYFHYCLENGKYKINLDFAEIRFTNDESYSSLGKRSFDIYLQEELVEKDFNIADKAGGAQKPVTVPFNVSVTDNYLAIRLAWNGRGTTRIPERGVYGPLISAISVVSDSRPCSHNKTGSTVYIAIGVVAPCVIFFILGILWWRGWLPWHCTRQKDTNGYLPSGTFTLKQLKAATKNFDTINKIGEGGFGPVYKGVLTDGRLIAVKQLSSKSRQGNREFLSEIGIISCVQHPNLVKLHGFCVEGDQLLLVYEYLENNNLARALFGPEHTRIKLDWSARFMICSGIAKGLSFLHEESVLKIVHRDIKATNVLLDKGLQPKISDFGLARLDESEKTHISTKVAGTIGYMAPEYALWGHLSFKADVYSFGVLALEIVSGKSNNSFEPPGDFICLLDWACFCVKSGTIMEIVDENLSHEISIEEAETVIKVAVLCTSASPSQRPTMSEVVSMLEGRMPVPDAIPKTNSYSEDSRLKAMRDIRRDKENSSFSGSQRQNSTNVHAIPSSSFLPSNNSQGIKVEGPNTC